MKVYQIETREKGSEIWKVVMFNNEGLVSLFDKERAVQSLHFINETFPLNDNRLVEKEISKYH